MLDEIQKIEQEVREKIEVAKAEAAVDLQHAQTKAAEERKNLEESLRAREVATIEKAEKEAELQATQLIERARTKVTCEVTPEAKTIAKEILSSYLK